MKAMILAAGRGERLRPLTDTLPKPLIPLGRKPIMLYWLERLAAAGFQEVLINVCYRQAAIRAAIGAGERWGVSVTYQIQETLEGPGGDVRRALDWLGDSPFLLVAGDIYCDIELSTLPPLSALGHMILVPNPPDHPNGDFSLIDGRVSLEEGPRYTYAAIGVYSPKLFQPYPLGYRDFVPVVRPAIQAEQVTASIHTGAWFDIGTPERYARAEHYMAQVT